MKSNVRRKRRWIGLGVTATTLALGAVVVGLSLGVAKGSSANTDAVDADATTAEQAAAEEAESQPKARPVAVHDVTLGEISDTIEATANLVPERLVTVLAETTGRIERLPVQEGDRVAAGQPLAEVERREAEIALKRAEIKTRATQRDLDRAERMLQEGLMSPEEFEAKKLEHETAAQALEEAEWTLEKTTVRAPFAGTVTTRHIEIGQHVRPGDALFAVADFQPLVAEIHVPEEDAAYLEAGQPVRLIPRATPDHEVPGRIQRLSPMVDTGTGTVTVRVEARDVPASVTPGCFVTVITERDRHASVPLVPKRAVIREIGTAYAFVAVDGKAERRELRLGLETSGSFEVLDGLQAGDRVVITGHGNLRNGTLIEIFEDQAALD